MKYLALILGFVVCEVAIAGDPVPTTYATPQVYAQQQCQIVTQQVPRTRTVYDTVTEMVPQQRTRMVPQTKMVEVTEMVPETYTEEVAVTRQVPRQETYMETQQFQMVPVQTYAQPCCPTYAEPVQAVEPVQLYARAERRRALCLVRLAKRFRDRPRLRRVEPVELVGNVGYGYGLEKH